MFSELYNNRELCLFEEPASPLEDSHIEEKTVIMLLSTLHVFHDFMCSVYRHRLKKKQVSYICIAVDIRNKPLIRRADLVRLPAIIKGKIKIIIGENGKGSLFKVR